MKTLYLLRHAKSTHAGLGIPDPDRPLDARGEHDAADAGRRWSKHHKKPDLIVSSPALRAFTTARLVAEGLDYRRKDIAVDDRLYAASMNVLIAVIEGLDDRLRRVMLVGHNPGLADLARHFSREITDMPTCALAEFTFDATTWAGIGRAIPASVSFDSPKSSHD